MTEEIAQVFEPESHSASPTGDPMMIAKFRVAPGPPVVVRRQRLFDRMSDAVRRPVTLVTAPAGAGKTTLVASWASAGLAPGTLTWITLDDGDDRPGVFWSYILEGLSRSGVPVSAVTAPSRPEAVDQSFLVRLSSVLYGMDRPVVLVIDDADVIAGGAVLDQIDFLLRHSGPQLRVVLITRIFPGPVMYRHRLAGSLTEIGFEDLAFTEPECRHLMRARGVTLPDDALANLLSRTRGWATGLVLAATSPRLGADAPPAVATLAGNRGELADYFAAEVLSFQPLAIRRFMRRTSILTHVRPALANQLTGRRDASRTLWTLARANCFLETCSEHDDCYIYYPLFAELLRDELGDEESSTVIRLHRRAAEWFRMKGSVTEAVRHATAAGDWNAAAAFLVDDLAVVAFLVTRDATGLAAVIPGMPQGVDGPDAALVLAVLALGESDVDACREHLSRVRGLVDEAALDRRTGLALTISLVELVLAGVSDEVEAAVAAARRAEALLDDLAADGDPVPSETRAFVLLSAGRALFSAGCLERAATLLAKGVAAAQDPACGNVRAGCLGLLALVQAVAGRLTRAGEFGHAAIAIAARGRPTPQHHPWAADLALAWVCAEACDDAPAQDHAERAAAAMKLSPDSTADALHALVRARLLRTAGDLEGALAVIREATEPTDSTSLPRWLEERLHAAEVSIEIVAGRPASALSSIRAADNAGGADVALELARAEFALGEVAKAGAAATQLLRRPDLSVTLHVDAWLLRASCALERGEKAQARTDVDRALTLAEPERIRRPVIEAPARLKSFIHQDGEITARHAWLGPARGSSPSARAVPSPRSAPASLATPVIVESLTEKEQEVLRHLADLLSTQEIAELMFVSVNTVKTHVRGILRKLAASRRNEAIRRARELRLI